MVKGSLSYPDIVTLTYWSKKGGNGPKLSGVVLLRVDNSMAAQGRRMTGW